MSNKDEQVYAQEIEINKNEIVGLTLRIFTDEKEYELYRSQFRLQKRSTNDTTRVLHRVVPNNKIIIV